MKNHHWLKQVLKANGAYCERYSPSNDTWSLSESPQWKPKTDYRVRFHIPGQYEYSQLVGVASACQTYEDIKNFAELIEKSDLPIESFKYCTFDAKEWHRIKMAYLSMFILLEGGLGLKRYSWVFYGTGDTFDALSFKTDSPDREVLINTCIKKNLEHALFCYCENMQLLGRRECIENIVLLELVKKIPKDYMKDSTWVNVQKILSKSE